MNQILSTNLNENGENSQNGYKKYKEPKLKEKKNSEPVEINKVVKFFVIALIIFGVLLITAGAYALYRNIKSGNIGGTKTEPTINIEYKSNSNSKLLVTITHDKKLEEILYYWNDEEQESIQIPDGQYAEFTTDIPKGTNTLHVYVKDENGTETEVEHEYKRQSNIVIESDNTRGTVVIKYDSKTEVEYMTYKWDDEEPKQVSVNTKNVQQELDARKGIHTLTVEMVDSDGNKESNVQQVKGVSRPTIEVSVDDEGENFVVKATDETGLEKIEYNVDFDDMQKTEDELSGTTAEYKIPIKDGENKLEIIIYNIDGVTVKKKVKYNN